MLFHNNAPIYIQISELLYQKILSGEYENGSRIPSVRDMAVALEVNPNTVTHAYTILQEEGVIENKRGIGYSTHDKARALVQEMKRKDFLNVEAPAFFNRMEQLELTLEEVLENHSKKKG